MASLPRDLAEGAGKARPGGGGVYLRYGSGTLLIKKWFYQKLTDRCIITEFLVIESKAKVVMEGEKKVEQEPNAPASECSYTVNYDGLGKLSADGNSRDLVIGIFGMDKAPDNVIADTLTEVCDDKQPAAGMLLRFDTYPKKIVSKPGEFMCMPKWSCVDKPGTGVNSIANAKARLACKTPEATVELALKHLHGASSTPADTSASNTAPPDDAPGLPDESPPDIEAPPPPDPLEGWTQHPKNPEFYYKGKEVKKKADILAGK